jgi:hypothetical protein
MPKSAIGLQESMKKQAAEKRAAMGKMKGHAPGGR